MIQVAKLNCDEMVVIADYIKSKETPILVRQKAQAVIFASNQVDIEIVSNGIGKTIPTIEKWLVDWNHRHLASLFTRHKDNHNAARLTAEQKAQIKEALQSPPSDYGLPLSFWTVPQVRNYIKAEFGVVYESDRSYHAILKFSGLSFHKPDTFDRKRDENKVKERIRTICEEIENLKQQNYEIFCADEVRIEQEAEIRRAWIKRNERTIIKVNRIQEHQSYLGLLSQNTFRCYLYRLAWQNSVEILGALKKFLNSPSLQNKKIAIIWDNASWHKSKEIKSELERGSLLERVHLIAMPPYAPDENPTEHIWNTAKAKRANIQDETFAETKTKFENFVRNKPFKYAFRDINSKYFRK